MNEMTNPLYGNKENTLLSRKSKMVDYMNGVEANQPVDDKYKFLRLLNKRDWKTDEQGIFHNIDGKRYNVTNFSKIEFLYNLRISENEFVRVIKIDNVVFELSSEHLFSGGKLSRFLLDRSSFIINDLKNNFQNLSQIILDLDNKKFVKPANGFGKINDNLWNLGNKIIINNKVKDFQEIVWSGKQGFLLEKTDKINIRSLKYSIEEIFKKFDEVYGKQSLLVMGYAVASMYFSSIFKQNGTFPLLYISGKAGSGKSSLSTLIGHLFGTSDSLIATNCETLSTPKGIENKSLKLYDLPMILNEVTKKFYPLIKTRFDGSSSVVSMSSKNGDVNEKKVIGSTIAVSVSHPLEPQILSRCILFDYNTIDRDQTKFARLWDIKQDFSSFIVEILTNIPEELILEKIKSVKKYLIKHSVEARTGDIFAVIGGCLLAAANVFKLNELDDDAIYLLMLRKAKLHEQLLDPAFPLMSKISLFLETDSKSQNLSLKNNTLYLNLNGFWNEVGIDFKKTHYEGYDVHDIKNMLVEKNIIMKYSKDSIGNDDTKYGKPIISHPVKINGKTSRCLAIDISILNKYRL